ncbi:MarR family winged helix-turn-helix transcriptional regulator [Fodinicola acaciae]|uniref:MarR family winged helix-turn-helix transcriptional regulator n=1 Tax=Fodinicola acaciae TaxID=2681555 RepID=UPI001C9E9998|nr:MarR family transcriptional regulator [Fodinicola acaciae]
MTGHTAAVEALDEISRMLTRQLASIGEVSFSALATLATLDASGPWRLTELAVRENVSQPSMTAMISRLVRQGMVVRGADPADARIALIEITDEGRAVLRRRRAGRLAFLSSLENRLTSDERHALAAAAPALRRLTEPEGVAAALTAAKEAATDA